MTTAVGPATTATDVDALLGRSTPRLCRWAAEDALEVARRTHARVVRVLERHGRSLEGV